jgi:phosphoserine aminotransferase
MQTGRYIPTMLDYTTHIKNGSMFNTPPVFPILIMNETQTVEL